MHILFAAQTLDPDHGGPAEACRQFAVAFRDLGHRVSVVGFDRPDSPYLDLPFPTVALSGRGRYGYARSAVSRLRGMDVDAVVTGDIWQYAPLACMRAFAGRTPFFVFTHGMLDPWFRTAAPVRHIKKLIYWRLIGKRIAAAAAAMLHTAEDEAMRIRRSGFHPLDFNARIVPLGVRGIPAPMLKTPPQTTIEGRRRLLFMARLQPQKACDLMIDAFADIAGDHPDLDLVMAGPDRIGWADALRRRAASRGVAERVSWPGALGGEAKWHALRSAWGFVSPSRFESFGVAVAEALSAGTPALVSDQTAVHREVEAFGAGFVCAVERRSLRRALDALASVTAEERRRLGVQARRCFEAHFEVSHAAARLAELISSHLHRDGAALRG